MPKFRLILELAVLTLVLGYAIWTFDSIAVLHGYIQGVAEGTQECLDRTIILRDFIESLLFNPDQT